MPITDPSEEYFKDGAWGWDGTRWRKLPLLLGYTDRWAESLDSVQSGDGTWSANAVAVPAGYIYVAQFVFMRNITGARGERYIQCRVGADRWFFVYSLTPAQYVVDIWNGGLVLKEGDYIRFVASTCLDGDSIKAGVWGYKMKVT